MPEEIELRVEGAATLPTLIYLPGLHGDWTLITNLSRCLRHQVHFVCVTYPRTLAWSLDEYASAVETALAAQNISSGWLLAESFSSQVAWAILGRGNFLPSGLILAGGFVKHPMRWIVRPVGLLCRRPMLRLFSPFYMAYVKMFRWKHRHHPETSKNVEAFISRRTALDLQAMRHRLRLIGRNDPQEIARQTRVPVYGITGLIDPIVPWPFVRRWLGQHCPALRDYQIIAASDHNVLNMAASASATQILAWLKA